MWDFFCSNQKVNGWYVHVWFSCEARGSLCDGVRVLCWWHCHHHQNTPSYMCLITRRVMDAASMMRPPRSHNLKPTEMVPVSQELYCAFTFTTQSKNSTLEKSTRRKYKKGFQIHKILNRIILKWKSNRLAMFKINMFIVTGKLKHTVNHKEENADEWNNYEATGGSCSFKGWVKWLQGFPVLWLRKEWELLKMIYRVHFPRKTHMQHKLSKKYVVVTSLFNNMSMNEIFQKSWL